MTEQRLIEIETRIAYQEDAQRELNDALVRQQQEIERLTRLCLSVQASLAGLAQAGQAPTPADEKPPHY